LGTARAGEGIRGSGRNTGPKHDRGPIETDVAFSHEED